jgi:Common central domain of tyrosinase
LDLLVAGQITGTLGYANFEEYLEILHGAPHNEIGGDAGDMADGRTSPADPIFYQHHGMIDRVWAEWQAAGNGNEFNGVHRVLPRNPNNQAVAPVSVNQVIGPARWGRTVQEILTGEPSTCVTYSGVARSTSARMAVQAGVHQSSQDSSGYSSPDVKQVVEVDAAKKKATEPEAYKDACSEVIKTRKTFYEGGKFAGFSKEFIDNVYLYKSRIDTACYGVLLKDVQDPESVVNKTTKEVMAAGYAKLQDVGAGTDLNSTVVSTVPMSSTV